MEQQKQETIEKLYALRGGLSVLSELYDNAKDLDKKIHQTKNRLELLNNHVPQIAADKASEEKQEYQNAIKQLRSNMNDKEKDISKIRSARKKILFGGIFTPIYLAIATFIAFYLQGYLNSYDNDGLEFIAWIFTLLTLIGAISLIVSIFRVFKNIADYIQNGKWLSAAKKKLTSLSTQYRNKINDQDEVFSRIEKERRERLKTNNELINKDTELLSNQEQDMQVLGAQFESAFKATQEQFSNLIDERDWGNIDLIIFNYETGRAMDMRDALMQVDNERRNERLIKAVRDANASISTIISRGFGELKAGLDAQCDMLDRRISGFSSQISQIASSTNEQTRILEGKLSEIAEISSTQNALIKKMNTSSDKMAADISRMRELEYYTYYKI